MKIPRFRARMIDKDVYVIGNYFRTPLTDENSYTDPEIGHFFLSNGETRHCIEQDHVCYVIDINTLSIMIDDIKIRA